MEKIRFCERKIMGEPGYWFEAKSIQTKHWNGYDQVTWRTGISLCHELKSQLDYVAFPLIAYRSMASGECLASNLDCQCSPINNEFYSAGTRPIDFKVSWQVEFNDNQITGEAGFASFYRDSEALYLVNGPGDLLVIFNENFGEHSLDLVMYGGNRKQLESVVSLLSDKSSLPKLSDVLSCVEAFAVIRSPMLIGKVHTMAIWGGSGLGDRLGLAVERFEDQVLGFESSIGDCRTAEEYMEMWSNVIHDLKP